MASFGCLQRDTIDMISNLMAECAFHVNPVPSSWMGVHMIQVQVQQVHSQDNVLTIDGWLCDPCLPRDMFSLDKRKRGDDNPTLNMVCECKVRVTGPHLTLVPGDVLNR